ncbi:MAG: hypothetical protein GY702_16120 [Desulfobulbaceae bacterium]|nr:hypothetical protein [Desulfobulbaceae bacterium]
MEKLDSQMENKVMAESQNEKMVQKTMYLKLVLVLLTILFPCGVYAGYSTGSVSGRVTDGDTGLGGILVTVYDASYAYLNDTVTDNNGAYSITNLPSGNHKIEYSAYGTDYSSEWYDSKKDFETADSVTVTAPTDTTIPDIALERSGSISGKITDETTGTGLIGVKVVLCSQPIPSMWSCVSGAVFTDTNGDYTITDLSPADYKIEFKADAGYVSEYYNNQSTLSNANPIAVTAGFATPGIDGSLKRAGSISGRVTDGNVGIAGVFVKVYDTLGNQFFHTPDIVETDINGDYTVTGLPVGSHKVEFSAGEVGYVSEWYNNTTNFSSSNSVTVAALADTPNINAVLERVPLGSISGRVTEGNTGITGVDVHVYDSSQTLLGSNTTDFNGDYIVIGLPSGNHSVEFSGSRIGYIDEWYNDKSDFATANPVTVNAPVDTTAINAVLVQAPTGSISGRVTNGNIGLAGVEVWFYSHQGSSWSGYSSIYTDSEGYYTRTDLPSGPYSVKFIAPPGYATECYNDKVSIFSSNLVTVTSATNTPDIDAVLEPGSAITGRVTDGNTAISGVSVYVRNNGGEILGSDSTDSNGDYVISGIPQGSYKVEFNPPIMTSYVEEWYNNKYVDEHAEQVLVVPPTDTTGIDSILELGGSLSGRVTDGDAGIFMASVQVYDSNSNMLNSTNTDNNGDYVITGLPPGWHRVHFSYWDDEYHGEWYKDQADFDSADQVNITSSSNTGNINANFALLGDINGDDTVNLKDIIVGLQVLSGSHPIGLNINADVDGDEVLGLGEVVYSLQKFAQ